MHLSLTPTKFAGGVKISGDLGTIQKVERLLARTSIESHACYDDGMCMVLSRYFEKKGDVVDWVTLVAGVASLRHSLGYRLSRENHALMCLLEHLVFEALCKTLDESRDKIGSTLDSLYNLNDRIAGHLVESRVVYLYLLKTPEKRKAQLLQILDTLLITGCYLHKEYTKNYEGLSLDNLCYPADQKFEYEL